MLIPSISICYKQNTISIFFKTRKTANNGHEELRNAPVWWLPRCFVDAIEHAFRCQSTEDNTGHTEGLVDGACPTGEDAAVPDAREGAVSGELEAVLLAQFAGKARVFAEGFVQISSQLEFRRQQPPMVVSDIRIFLRN
ncbi:hypothetical protein GBA52_027005 [Prunus armeniaca]|nr:hypothetical protein GBA52_027005 [Prunus armeniaca]